MVAPIIRMPNTVKHNGVSGLPTQLLVLHSGESPLRGGYAQSLTDWANTPLEVGGPIASWHWFVDPIAIVEMVDPNYAAWHASEANPMSEGFEQAGYARFSRAEWETPEGAKQLENLAWIMAQRAKALGIPPVWLTTDQVEAVTHRGNRTIKGFCLHAQIDPDMRTDPGQNYPYDRLMNRIKDHLGANGSPAKPAPTPPSQGELTMAEAADIMRELSNIKGVLLNGYVETAGGAKKPSIVAIVSENQRRINALPDAVWRSTTVFRGGKEVQVLQELANNTTTGQQTLQAVNALKAIIEKTATGATLDNAAVQRIIQETADKTAATFADNTIQVEVKVAAPEPEQVA